MIELIDAHCHLNLDKFNKDRDEVIRRAKAAGVIEIIDSGFDYYSNFRALQLRGSNIHVTLGLSPNRIPNSDVERTIAQIAENADSIAGIGEVGLDVVKCPLPLEKQKEVFTKFIELAEELEKPLVIHARKSESEALKMISRRYVTAMFHCFSGSIKVMRNIENSNHMISLSTLVCFSQRHQEIASKVNLENLMLETDSPFLSPVRGRNEPANLVFALRKIAEIKEMSNEELATITFRNTQKFFKL